MSTWENFIARWSRRKREVANDPAAKKAADSTEVPASEPPAASDPASPQSPPDPSTPPFDAASLPPIDTITANTDIRGFLAPGVPPELTRAALRRVWRADPQIRDFVGLADYDWDFNTPGAIAGFGPSELTDDVRRQLVDMVGRSLAAEPREEAAP